MGTITANSKSRPTPFKTAHLLEYGLAITQRDPKTLQVCSVRCQFCTFFGREQIAGQKRQRKQTENEKFWGPPFRPEYCRDHHEKQHHMRWEAYKLASTTDKQSYFNEKIKHKETIPHHFSIAHFYQIFEINTALIENVVGDMFFHSEDDIAS